MKLLIYIPLNPSCAICYYTMYIESGEANLKEPIKRVAFCVNKKCPQNGKRFIIQPIEMEVIEE